MSAPLVTLAAPFDPLIPEGSYEVFFIRWTTTPPRPPWKAKINLFFAIFAGEFQGLELCRHYNAESLTTKPGLSGGFSVGPKSDYVREFVECNGLPSDETGWLPARYQLVLADVATVHKSSKEENLAEPLWYSKIAKLRPRT
jgi:hypothetical protein